MKIKFLNLGTFAVFALTGLANPAVADEFSFSFEWGDIPNCTDGYPNSVPNPIFTLSGVPKGTKKIVFAMTDLDVPQFDHGGGSAAYNGDNTIQPGAFEYDSPCPPNGTHTYEWEATAKDSNNDTVGKASAEKSYP